MALRYKWQVNYKKKIVMMFVANDNRIIEIVSKVICHEEDEFSPQIGIALSIERFCGKNIILERNKKRYLLVKEMLTKDGKLDYKKYADFVIDDFFNFDSIEIDRAMQEDVKTIK